MEVFIGIDVGSVSTKIAAISKQGEVIARVYIPTSGDPLTAVKNALRSIKKMLDESIQTESQNSAYRIAGVGTTGSGRGLAALMVGADIAKNEITAHATAAVEIEKDVKTILEIGGQDSKIILLRDGIVTDFAMNTVCAAGTGSFLEHQAQRLGVPITEFGSYALRAKTRVRIAGRCTVFAESDMIHKQQLGFTKEDIIAGLCDALVRNYLNNVGRGKQIEEPILFQGGVAANIGIKDAFERFLGKKVQVPKYYNIMGAIGAALLAKDFTDSGRKKTAFKGFEQAEKAFKTTSFECNGCSNMCEIIQFIEEGHIIARWGDRCGKWQNLENHP
ncbi:MAG: acyl-CoA dehydratase activase [Thermoplasmata archaeon]